MAARTGGNTDKTIGTFFDCLAGKAIIDYIVETDSAIGVYGLKYFRARTQ
jgi:hypothetical protein